jgi:hypothetical protein
VPIRINRRLRGARSVIPATVLARTSARMSGSTATSAFGDVSALGLSSTRPGSRAQSCRQGVPSNWGRIRTKTIAPGLQPGLRQVPAADCR